MTVTDPDHVATPAMLRQDYQHLTPPGCAQEEEEMVRDLADYDRAFGLGEANQP